MNCAARGVVSQHFCVADDSLPEKNWLCRGLPQKNGFTSGAYASPSPRSCSGPTRPSLRFLRFRPVPGRTRLTRRCWKRLRLRRRRPPRYRVPSRRRTRRGTSTWTPSKPSFPSSPRNHERRRGSVGSACPWSPPSWPSERAAPRAQPRRLEAARRRREARLAARRRLRRRLRRLRPWGYSVPRPRWAPGA